jgi:ribosomal protein L36
MTESQVKCHCGKLLAIQRNGKIYVYCKRCKTETEIPVISYKEPRATEPRAVSKV